MRIYKIITKGEMLWSLLLSIFSLQYPYTELKKVMRIYKKDHLRRNALIFYQILSTIT